MKNSRTTAEVSSEFLLEVRGPGRAGLLVECLAKSKSVVPPILNPIFKKNASVEERGVINMFDKVGEILSLGQILK